MDHPVILKDEQDRLGLSENGGPALIKCSLCGYLFEKGRKTACASCPLHYGSCHFERCPHCGFDIPQESRLWGWVMNMKNKFKTRG